MTSSVDGPSGDTFVGLVPSAGSSVRMGRPKGLLRVEGESFLQRTVRALTRGGCHPVYVVVPEGEGELLTEAQATGAVVLENPEPGEGPITSMRMLLGRLDRTVAGVVYLPVDHPMVRHETVASLLREARRSGAPLTLPVRGAERGHPAVFAPVLFGELADPALEGGARTVVHRHLAEACTVQVDDPGVLTDIDTPAAYESVLATRADAPGGTS